MAELGRKGGEGKSMWVTHLCERSGKILDQISGRLKVRPSTVAVEFDLFKAPTQQMHLFMQILDRSFVCLQSELFLLDGLLAVDQNA